jgi:ketosteroid isomerase-like protein
MSAEGQVIEAAVALIDAFARNDRPRYFAAFAPEATFIFHSTNRVLASRAAYEAEWDSWVRDLDFKVKDCVSTHRVAKVYGSVGVFTHQTETHIATKDGEQSYHERETIIFHNVGGKWVAVHEHLSMLPE